MVEGLSTYTLEWLLQGRIDCCSGLQRDALGRDRPAAGAGRSAVPGVRAEQAEGVRTADWRGRDAGRSEPRPLCCSARPNSEVVKVVTLCAAPNAFIAVLKAAIASASSRSK